MIFKRCLLSPLLCLLLFAPTVVAQQLPERPAAMTNEDVIALVSAGLGDEIVIAKINAAPITAFDTTLTGLKALKAANVSVNVVKVMIYPASVRSARAAATAPRLSDPDDPEGPHSRGIYLMSYGLDGRSHMSRMGVVDPKEVVLIWSKARVRLDGEHAPLQIVDPNPTFYAYAGEDAATFTNVVKRLVLIKLDVNSKGRQISIGGPNEKFEKEKQEIEFVMQTSGVLKGTLTKPLPPGEYAFYEAGTWGPHTINGGEYLDFGVSAKP